MNRELKGQIIKVTGSQWRFAEMVNKPEPVISQIIHGRRQLPPEEKARWAELLGADVEKLFPQEG